MKKLIALSIVLVVLTGAVFAQVPDGVTFGAWGRTYFTPFESHSVHDEMSEPNTAHTMGDNKTEAYSTTGTTWGWGMGDIEFDLKAEAEQIGMVISLNGNGGSVGTNDFAEIWAKPISWVRIDIGKFNIDNLRGKVGLDSEFNRFISGQGTSWAPDPDAIFTRFQTGNGWHITATPDMIPIPGQLFFQFGLGSNKTEAGALGYYDGGWNPTAFVPGGDSWASMQLGVGYEIPNIGLLFRVQYLGARSEPTITGEEEEEGADPYNPFGITAKKIEVAFAYTGMADSLGLTIDFGGKIPIPATKIGGGDYTYMDPIKVALGASYAQNGIGVTAGLYFGLLGGYNNGKSGSEEDTATKGVTFDMHLIPSYDLSFGTVGLDVGLGIKGEGRSKKGAWSNDIEDGSTLFGIGAWLKQDLGKGHITYGAGFNFDTVVGKAGGDDIYKGTDIYIPIIVEYAF
ncbi:MAG: hypothetical protein LBK83_08345 [Treponema sp.]|jgi:hypothetical protein|nr:hypothetical protein [Treponema sp.]